MIDIRRIFRIKLKKSAAKKVSVEKKNRKDTTDTVSNSKAHVEELKSRNEPVERTLTEEIDAFLKFQADNLPPEQFSVLRETARDLIDMKAAEGHLRTQIPEFSLFDLYGEKVASKELLGDGLTVLVFYRGSWCPFCNMQLVSYQKHLREFDAVGAKVVAISPNLPTVSNTLAKEKKIEYTILSDIGNKVSKLFGICFEVDDRVRNIFLKHFDIDLSRDNGDDSWEIPLASTFIVDRNGKILFTYVEADYVVRPEPLFLLQKIKELHGN